MILPYLDNGDIFYMNANSVQVKKLQTLQNCALKICQSIPNIPIDILHQSARIPKLIPRRVTHLRNFVFKNRSNSKNVNTRNVRTRLQDAPVFTTYKPNCEKYKANSFYIGAISWNQLPVHIRNTKTYDMFKNSNKKRALSQP